MKLGKVVQRMIAHDRISKFYWIYGKSVRIEPEGSGELLQSRVEQEKNSDIFGLCIQQVTFMEHFLGENIFIVYVTFPIWVNLNEAIA